MKRTNDNYQEPHCQYIVAMYIHTHS